MLEEGKGNQLSAIILAGGDGSRLSSLTRKIAGKVNEWRLTRLGQALPALPEARG